MSIDRFVRLRGRPRAVLESYGQRQVADLPRVGDDTGPPTRTMLVLLTSFKLLGHACNAVMVIRLSVMDR